jgi:hypothetical protein
LALGPAGHYHYYYHSPNRVILLVIGPARVPGQPGERDGELVGGAGDVVWRVWLRPLDDQLGRLHYGRHLVRGHALVGPKVLASQALDCQIAADDFGPVAGQRLAVFL